MNPDTMTLKQLVGAVKAAWHELDLWRIPTIDQATNLPYTLSGRIMAGLADRVEFVGNLTQERDAALDELAALRGKMAAAVEALEAVEWVEVGDYGPWCPSCRGLELSGGHRQGCQLKATLVKMKGK